MIEYLSWLGLVTVVVAHPVPMHVLRLMLHQRMTVRLERERRVTLIDVLERVRPGGWVVEDHGTGYRRLVGRSHTGGAR